MTNYLIKLERAEKFEVMKYTYKQFDKINLIRDLEIKE